MTRVLILGGTRDARLLALELVQEPSLDVQMSLAGRTADPLDQGVPTRIGGFGGAKGLAEYLTQNAIDLVIDATHPFASQMSQNAAQAHQASGVALLHVQRPPWSPQDDEIWWQVPDIEAAVHRLPAGARAFAATGRGSLDAFLARPEIFVLMRIIDPPDVPYPGNGAYVVARPPFDVPHEITALKEAQATHLVVKNAGGGPARTKLTAAAALGLPIVVVDRTPLPKGAPIATNVAEAARWVHAFRA